MTDLVDLFARFGPLLERSRLLAEGVTVHQIAVAVRVGAISRVRRAWYASADAPWDARVAVSLGGRLGSLSAARSYGLWTGLDRAVHVSWPPHGNVALPGRRLAYPATKLAAGVAIVPRWSVLRDAAPPPDASPWRESVEQSLAQVLTGCDRVTAIACVDSALHSEQISRGRLREICSLLPARVPSTESFDARCDSGIESIVRIWLTDHGIPFLLHPLIDGVGEVDFLVGSLIIETDGRAYHSDPAAFERDRRRDHAAALRGYVTVRLSYGMVMEHWAEVEERLRAHLARRDHLRIVG